MGTPEMVRLTKEERTPMAHGFDLDERLLAFSVEIVRLTEALPTTRSGNHVAAQLLRCGTSPYPNHGEAQAAESARDFVHKFRIGLKELRETRNWLRLVQGVPLSETTGDVTRLLQECDELIRIFAASIRTVEKRL